MGEAVNAGGECMIRCAHHVDCGRRVAGEEMHITRFFGSGLTRENGGERGLALAEAVEGGDDVVEGLEVIHAFGAAAKFAGSLQTAEEKHAEDGDFATIEIENFLQAV